MVEYLNAPQLSNTSGQQKQQHEFTATSPVNMKTVPSQLSQPIPLRQQPQQQMPVTAYRQPSTVPYQYQPNVPSVPPVQQQQQQQQQQYTPQYQKTAAPSMDRNVILAPDYASHAHRPLTVPSDKILGNVSPLHEMVQPQTSQETPSPVPMPLPSEQIISPAPTLQQQQQPTVSRPQEPKASVSERRDSSPRPSLSSYRFPPPPKTKSESPVRGFEDNVISPTAQDAELYNLTHGGKHRLSLQETIGIPIEPTTKTTTTTTETTNATSSPTTTTKVATEVEELPPAQLSLLEQQEIQEREMEENRKRRFSLDSYEPRFSDIRQSISEEPNLGHGRHRRSSVPLDELGRPLSVSRVGRSSTATTYDPFPSAAELESYPNLYPKKQPPRRFSVSAIPYHLSTTPTSASRPSTATTATTTTSTTTTSAATPTAAATTATTTTTTDTPPTYIDQSVPRSSMERRPSYVQTLISPPHQVAPVEPPPPRRRRSFSIFRRRKSSVPEPQPSSQATATTATAERRSLDSSTRRLSQQQQQELQFPDETIGYGRRMSGVVLPSEPYQLPEIETQVGHLDPGLSSSSYLIHDQKELIDSIYGKPDQTSGMRWQSEVDNILAQNKRYHKDVGQKTRGIIY